MKRWLEKNMLWIVGVGLMLASSGIDGVYMAKWMPVTALGFILNTVADVADMVLAHKYGKLQRKKSTEKRKWALLLLAGEACAIGYSWFFSWLQLRIVLQVIEPQDYRWIAPIAAGFIPVLLAFLGFAQALDDTDVKLLETNTQPVQVAQVAVATETLDTPVPQLNERQIATIEYLASQPSANYTQIGQASGVSRTTAKKDTQVLIEAGRLRSNGKGWEVQ